MEGEHLVRRVVPADNSCLFVAVAHALEGGDRSRAPALREVVASAVLADQERFSEAVLGRPPAEYAAWIRDKQHWGGGIELAILAEHFKTELAAVDCQSLRVDCFGQGCGYSQRVLLIYDGIHYDLWGTGYRAVHHGSGGAYSEAVDLPLAKLETLDDVERYAWPSPDGYDYSAIFEQCERLKDYAICLGGAGDPDIVNGVSRGRGMERVLMDIALRDEVGLAIIDRRVDFSYQVLRRGIEAAKGKVDILCLGEDCGNQNGRMVSPRDFDEVFRPRLQRFYGLAHEFGAKAMMHSCGDTHDPCPPSSTWASTCSTPCSPSRRAWTPRRFARCARASSPSAA